MDIDKKLESLLKYVPFIDYIIKIDSTKYVKFIDIRKWITEKKRLALSDLNKIEQSIIANYKNITALEDRKIPQDIAKIFYTDFTHQYVNLCSDDEDCNANVVATNEKCDKQSSKVTLTKSAPPGGGSGSKTTTRVQSDSEDDIEIVSISYIQKSNKAESSSDSTITPKREVGRKKSSGSTPPPPATTNDDLDDGISKLLDQIDEISCEDLKNHSNGYIEPHNYCVDDCKPKQDVLFQRRPQRSDTNCKRVEENDDQPSTSKSALAAIARIDTISLDSSDDEETTKQQSKCDNISNTQAVANKMVLPPKTIPKTNSINEKKLTACAVLKPESPVDIESCSSATNEITISSATNTQSSNTRTDYDTEKLTNDELCRLIEHQVKSLGFQELQALANQIMQKEPPTASIEHHISSPSSASSSNRNETSLKDSPPPPAPRIEPTESPERLFRLLYQFLERAEKNERQADIPRNSANYESPPNFVPFTPSPQQYMHQNPQHQHQQQLNFYNNSAMQQTSMCHPANAMPQSMYPPQVFTPFNQQTAAAYIPGISQSFAAAQTNLKSRDPRAKSALYQNSLKIIEAEVAKRNSNIYRDNIHQPHVPPVLLPNNSLLVPNQPIERSAPILAQQQQQYFRMSTGIAPMNVQTSQQQKYAAHKTITTNTSESARAKTKKSSITYGEYKRRRISEGQQKVEKQLEQDIRQQEPLLLTQIDAVPAPNAEHAYKQRQIEDQQRKATETPLRVADKNQEDKREKEDLQIQPVETLLKSKEAEELEMRESHKKRSDLHSILFSALQPYEDKIAKVWNAKKVVASDKLEDHNTETSKERDKNNDDKQQRKLKSVEKENANDICGVKKRKKEALASDATKAIFSKATKDNEQCNQQPANLTGTIDVSTTSNINDINKKNSTEKSDPDAQRNRINSRMNRLFKEMECTVKGFEQLPATIGGKRRSSIHARTFISEQLRNSSQESVMPDDSDPPPTLTENAGKRRSSFHANQLNNTDSSDTQNGKQRHPCLAAERATIQKSTPPIRRSSIHARFAIAEQLCSQSSLEVSDNYILSDDSVSYSSSSADTTNVSKNRNAAEAMDYLSDATYIANLIAESEMIDCGESSRLSQAQKLKENILKRQPKILLRRLTKTDIKKHTKVPEKPKIDNILNVHLIESGIRPDTTNATTSKTSATSNKKSPPKKCNNDCQMTERNTKFCALCSSKPSDLTNHYKRKHKSESYVARLTWSELDELCINTPFAKLVPSTNSRILRYAVICPFCDERLVVPFMNLYSHYASHTGEYAFQCGACQLDKPFRADIQSHQLHSKICRNSQIQTMYRYPPNTMSIYLYYCTICNFVQLNEANILKHLREHHDPRKSTSENVKRCILAAISDGPDSASNEAQPPSNTAAEQSQKIESESDVSLDLVGIEPEPENENNVMTKPEMDLNLDDNIPVFNEACTEDPFDLEERLRQIHEEQSCEKSTARDAMTVIHFDGGKSLVEGSDLGVIINKAPSRHVPKVFKTEDIDFGENNLQTPPRPLTISKRSSTKNIAPYCNYRCFPANVNYLGLYKCMADDCFYSSDSPDEYVKHLEDHQRENPTPGIYLLCPYCILPTAYCQTVHQLVDHIRTQHAHLVYQCSMCCYRSCESSNVLIHQKENHKNNYQICKIYKCFGTELSLDANYFKENMSDSVAKVQCSYCSESFYNTVILMQHISSDHNVDVQDRIERYSCIYCHFCDKDQSVTRKHVALSHPGELPFLCDHSSSTVSEDSLHYMEPTSLSDSVPIIDVPSTYDTVPKVVPAENNCEEDIKPNVGELLKYQATIRLRKLTGKTGVAPDCLYRCPELLCERFFSIYDLWLRHMRLKHCCFENRCPHCPTQTIKSLEDFKYHFEEHRRHTYVCFQCAQTYANSQSAENHWLTEHSNLGLMHVEQIRYNLNYSYYIMMPPNQFQNQLELFSALCDICDQRIKLLESNEASKLKHKWLVPTGSSTLWLEDYPKHNMSPRLVKKCFNGHCNFRTKSDSALFSHVRATHDMSGSIFKCSKCDFRLANSTSWDEALNHIKQHSETRFFICCACSNYYLCRSKIAEHVRSAHAARDVPIVTLLKTGAELRLHAKIAIVFANEHMTFSSMRNCFCCDERNMRGTALMLHLKRYHRFVLNYFCEWCNLPIDSLQNVEKHFLLTHTTNKLKIRCELASKSNLSILSVKEFQIQISSNYGDETDNRLSPIMVKEEPADADADDSVIILEDDDVLAENYEKTQATIEEKAQKPKLACIATASLLDPSTRHSTDSQNINKTRILPRVKVVPTFVPGHGHVSSHSNDNTIAASTSNIQPNNFTDSVISSQRITLLPTAVSGQSSNTNVSNMQPNSNDYIPSNNMMAATVGHRHTQDVQSITVPQGVVSMSLTSAVSKPHYYYTNTLPQSVIACSNSSYRVVDMQSIHSGNIQQQFAQGPRMTTSTSFLNSNQVPTTQTTTAPGMSNAQASQHHIPTYTNANILRATIANSCNFQNQSHSTNANTWPKTIQPQAPSTYMSARPAAPPQNQLYLNSIQTPHVPPSSSGHAMHPNYNLPTAASVSYRKY